MFYNFKANDIIEEYREGSEPSLVVELLKIIIAEDNSVEVDEEKLKAVFEEAKNNSRLARLVKKYKAIPQI